MACSAQQMSHAWTLCKLDAIDKHIQSKKAALEKKQAMGRLSNKEQHELLGFQQQEKDMKQVRQHVEGNHYRRRTFRAKVKNGVLEYKISDANEVDGVVGEKTPDRRGKVESGRASKDVKKTRRISLKNPPKGGSDLEVYKEYFNQIETGLQKGKYGLSESEAKKVVHALKDAYKKGEVIHNAGAKGQADFLVDKVIAILKRKLDSEPLLANRFFLRKQIRLMRASKKLEKALRPEWFENGMKMVKKSAIKTFKGVKSIKYINGFMTQSGKVVASLPKGFVPGLGAGVASFAFDAGDATYGFLKGDMFRPEFERKIADAAVVGGTVGTGTGVAIAMGAGPAGWVVLAIGVGGYFITDLAVQQWHKTQDRKYITQDDLAIFGIEAKETIPLNVGHWKNTTPLQFENWSK